MQAPFVKLAYNPFCMRVAIPPRFACTLWHRVENNTYMYPLPRGHTPPSQNLKKPYAIRAMYYV